jgi:hypothetical protein
MRNRVCREFRCCSLVGQTPRSAAGPLAGFSRPSTKADEGVGRGPGGPPDQAYHGEGNLRP